LGHLISSAGMVILQLRARNLRELGRRKGVPFATRGCGMYRQKDLHTTYGLREILLFPAAGMAICFVAAMLLAN
jgi:hypothetical protein